MAKTKTTGGQASSAPTGVLVQTMATALGEDTLASTTVNASVQSHGRVTITRGEVTTTAFASSDGGTAYAVTGQDVTPINADVFHAKTTVVDGAGSTSEASWSFESTTTTIFSVDNPGKGHGSTKMASGTLHTSVVEQPPLVVDGNAAHLTLDLTATGGNSIVSAEAMVLATDGLSDVNTMLVLGTDHIFP